MTSYPPSYDQPAYSPGYNNPPMHQAPLGQVQYVGGQTVIIQQTSPTILYDRYQGSASIPLGIIMIICGVACIAIDIVLFILGLGGLGSAYGIWGSGLMLVLAGSFAIGAAKKKTKCMVIACMVLCIITAVVCFIAVIVYAIPAAGGGYITTVDCYTLSSRSDREYCERVKDWAAVLTGLYAAIAALSLVGGVLAIVTSTLGCKVACCGAQPTPQTVQAAQFQTKQPAPGNNY